MKEAMRIHRALARAGIASRRGSEELVAAGRVRVNGVVAAVGSSIDPVRDKVTVDHRDVAVAPKLDTWIVLHKPAGVMTTRSDPGGRPTVFSLVRDVPGLTYVGRLDLLTEGLLLLTTDGAAAHALTHPSREVERVYEATVRGNAEAAARHAPKGVELEDGMAQVKSATARPLGGGRSVLELTLTEGRKREVRRICQALGLEVERLVRVRYGPVTLGALPSGATRALTTAESRALRQMTGARPRRNPSSVSGVTGRRPGPRTHRRGA